jgi:diaminopimelate decarboxylase
VGRRARTDEVPGRITLAGQLCTPKDVLARRVPAPGLRAGDRVAFALAGAYAWNISHHDFLIDPRPGFHFLDGSSGARTGLGGRVDSAGLAESGGAEDSRR